MDGKPLIFGGNNHGGLLPDILWSYHRNEFRPLCRDMSASCLKFAISFGDRLLVAVEGNTRGIFVKPHPEPGFRYVIFARVLQLVIIWNGLYMNGLNSFSLHFDISV